MTTEKWRLDRDFWEDRLVLLDERGDEVALVGHHTSMWLKKDILAGNVPREGAAMHVYASGYGAPLRGLFFDGRLVFYFDDADSIPADTGVVEKPD